MSNALVSLEPKDLTELKGVAQVFAESGLFADSKSMAQAFVKIMAGREIGIGAFAAMQGIYIVDNKPTYSANVMAAAIKRSAKYDYRVVELTDARCEVHFYQAGEKIGVSALTMNEARNANMDKSWDKTKNGWKEKPTWKNFPKNMLFARAMSNGVRWFCPDVFDMPVYTPDELGSDIDEENVIDGSVVENSVTGLNPEPDNTPTPSEPDDEPMNDDAPFNAKTLQDLIDYTIEHSPDIDASDTGARYAGGGRLYKALTGSDNGKADWKPLFGTMTYGEARRKVDARIALKNSAQPALMDNFPNYDVIAGPCKGCGDTTQRKDFIGDWFCEDCAIEAAEQAHSAS
jgi:hypothetical protein